MSERTKEKCRRGRRKGAGTLERRGRVYIARWTADGKRYAESTGTGDRREAERRLAELVAPFQLRGEGERLEAIAGRLGGVKSRLAELEASRPMLTIADAFEAFRKSPSRADTAGEAHLRRCEYWHGLLARYIAEHYPNMTEMRHVDREAARAFAAEGLAGVSAAVRNQAIGFLRMEWRVLMEDGAAGIAANPWDGIRRRHETHTRRRELTIAELVRVRALLEGEMLLMFEFGIYTGQRMGDIATLDWGSVDLERRRISLMPRKTARKTRRVVVVPIHAELFAALSAIPQGARRGYVMPGMAARYLRGHGGLLSRDWCTVFERAGIETRTQGGGGRARSLVSFHALRHTFVSAAANAGVPLAVVQGIVGHSTVGMTEHYYHESEAALECAVAALPSIGAAGANAALPAPSGVGADCPPPADCGDGSKPCGHGDGADISPRLAAALAAAEGLTEAERAELVRRLTGAGAAALPCASTQAA